MKARQRHTRAILHRQNFRSNCIALALTSAFSVLSSVAGMANAQSSSFEPAAEQRRATERLRQQEETQRAQEQSRQRPAELAPALDYSKLPQSESPCFAIKEVRLVGDASEQFHG